MEILLFLMCIILFISISAVIIKIIILKNIVYKEPKILSDKRILIVYYSKGGNTKNIAENIHFITGGDIKEIQPVKNYPNNIFQMSKLVRKQIREGYLPEIDSINISDYDVIFVGFPIWNFSPSLPIKSFLKNTDFENKTIIPFFTCSGGVSKNKVMKELKVFTKQKDVRKPLLMFENGIFLIKEQIIKWLNNIP